MSDPQAAALTNESQPTDHCGERMWVWEIPEYYDGALFYLCRVCGAWRHRFPVGHDLRARAERAANDNCNPADEIE